MSSESRNWAPPWSAAGTWETEMEPRNRSCVL